MKKLEIAVVDDIKSLAEIIASFLREDGHKVEVFFDPRDVLKSEKLSDFDVVISDYNMPEMNGIELIRRISEKNQKIVSVIISANLNSIPREERNSGLINTFIDKGGECWSDIEDCVSKAQPLNWFIQIIKGNDIVLFPFQFYLILICLIKSFTN